MLNDTEPVLVNCWASNLDVECPATGANNAADEKLTRPVECQRLMLSGTGHEMMVAGGFSCMYSRNVARRYLQRHKVLVNLTHYEKASHHTQPEHALARSVLTSAKERMHDRQKTACSCTPT